MDSAAADAVDKGEVVRLAVKALSAAALCDVSSVEGDEDSGVVDAVGTEVGALLTRSRLTEAALLTLFGSARDKESAVEDAVPVMGAFARVVVFV